MKRLIAMAALCILLLTGCAAPSGPTNEELGWDVDWARVGALLGVEPMAGFDLNENIDAMGIYGLYYATWTAGEGQSYTNADGDEARLFDAQIYVLLQQCGSEDEARTAAADWMTRERENYETGGALAETYAGQDFELLPLLRGGEDNPYTHGTAAFGVRGEWAICAELLCRDTFESDPQTCLMEFLSGLHYSDKQEA